ncbi:hypothetical protein BS78_05G232800 [Paspalum vaginatum]|nr:hypothetical protein BS78_05G232800 [Paspalum vaginatum]
MQIQSMETERTTAVAVLPDDLLAGILGRLPARSLAASRCVCTSWRGLVDARRLLLPHLLPHSVRGLFLNYYDHETPHFFAHPAMPTNQGSQIDGSFQFVVAEGKEALCYHLVLDQCNGLLLFGYIGTSLWLCNPATRWWTRLPERSDGDWRRRPFVVFDPAVSPHWEVMLAPHEPREERHPDGIPSEKDGAWRRTMEWPPAAWTWHVFSSATMRWEERVFVRQGEAAGTVGSLLDLDEHFCGECRYGAYCNGALYMHCRGEYVSRLSLSTNTYQVIKSPIDVATESQNQFLQSFIGRSQHGVYFAALGDEGQLRVWILKEEACERLETEWLLKHDRAVNPDEEQMQDDGPWIFDDYYDTASADQGEESLEQRNMGWDSDNDNIVSSVEDEDHLHDNWHFFLGFHPYKEIIFLEISCYTVAYHFNGTNKVQYLGKLCPRSYNRGLYESFVYTPCRIRVV